MHFCFLELVPLNFMINTTVGTSVSYTVILYSDLQAITKQAYQIMALQNPCGLLHSYSLPLVTLGSSAVQCMSWRSQEKFVTIAPIPNKTFCFHYLEA